MKKTSKVFHISDSVAFYPRMRRERGNVSVTVALSLGAIVFCLALAVDLGVLSMEKDSLQNKADAAVQSGARRIYDGTASDVADQMAASFQANGENVSADDVSGKMQVGFYDAKDIYADFSPYKNFALPGQIPSGENANAVALIDLKKKADTLEAKPTDSASGRVGVSSVAYGPNYTFLALSTSSTAISIGKYSTYGWASGYPVFNNCMIGSNGGISFYGTETFSGTTVVEAVGTITKGGSAPTRQCGKFNVPAINWDKLYTAAQENGKIYDISTWTTTWQTDELGNSFKCPSASINSYAGYKYKHFVFLPRGADVDSNPNDSVGDHGGKTYYFDTPSDDSYICVITFANRVSKTDSTARTPYNRQFWNCTLAGKCHMSTIPMSAGNQITTLLRVGNYATYGESGLVYFYSSGFGLKKLTTVNPDSLCAWYTANCATYLFAEPRGAIVRTEGLFRLYGCIVPTDPMYLKVIADEIIINTNPSSPSALGKGTFAGGFGKPEFIRLGNLETTE